MVEFNKLNIEKEYELHSLEKQQILDNIKNIIVESNSLLEGNSFYIHGSLNLYSELYTKQLNLFWCGMQASTKICEIGFNAGHSCMLMLLGREKTSLDFTIFDIGHHNYTKPCLDYMIRHF
jgi:tRNA(Leu) C34 or U34 (ribose-2'-O)-methylase TrmL